MELSHVLEHGLVALMTIAYLVWNPSSCECKQKSEFCIFLRFGVKLYTRATNFTNSL